ncbi:amidohydrolase [Fusibacter paucivorans]|uniref:Amidohydrolase n=1 Tax=Fusibacter paucivorans TaxID=76009 RepID=A0ABS5PP35_9FIRM|nr:amidohydrolase [Fusibacter paucivorans]MBS7526935.1 amidohydrolase [Fusibacter paucivorans]
MEQKADLILKNGHVITMDSERQIAEAIAVRNGRILAVGSNAAVCSFASSETKVVDVHRRTILPGFIDAHSHFLLNGVLRKFCVDLRCPPMGRISSIADIRQALEKKVTETPEGEPILGEGYDDTLLMEQRTPTRYDLDLVSTKHPIIILHACGHALSANSFAITAAGMTEENTPSDMIYRRDPSNGKLMGIFEEMAMMQLLKHFVKPDESMLMSAFAQSTEEYLAAGVTSAQEGAAIPQMLGFYKTAYQRGIIKNRIQMLPHENYPLDAYEQDDLSEYAHMLSVGATKIFADGSLQAYTAYLTNPYYKQHPTMHKGSDLFRGFPARPREALIEAVEKYHIAGRQIAIHANGDAAIDDVLAAFTSAQAKYPRPDARHIIVHCQSVREDQLDRIQDLQIIPSFYASHVYYHGDRHYNLFLGPFRASRVHPCRSALDREMIFTNHNDSPATPISPLTSVWSAVNRMTSGGRILGENQTIPVYEALKSVTIHAAYQSFEETCKGSIEPNKYADFVILKDNPLTIATDKIKDIPIEATVIDGKFVWGELGAI